MTAPQDSAAWPSSPRATTFQGSGVELAADVWDGDPERTVLFLHGGGQTRQAWGRTCEAVAERNLRVIALDLRGHGDSSWPAEADYDFEHFGLDVLEVTGTLGVRPVAVGASLGGISLLTAQRLQADPTQQMFTGVVLVDITPRMEIAGMKRIFEFMTAHPDGFESIDEAAGAIAAYMPHREPPKDMSGLRKVLRPTEDGRWRWHWDLRFITVRIPDGDDVEALAAQRAESVRGDMLRGAGYLTVPTEVVRGTKSDLVSDEGVRELLAAVPHATYVDVRNATHMVAGDENDAFTDAILDFVDRVWPTG